MGGAAAVTSRRPPRGAMVAWTAWLLAVTGAVGSMLIPGGTRDDVIFRLVFIVFIGTLGGVGALILTRQPRHRIGQMMLAVGVLYGLAFFLQEWAMAALVRDPGSLPGGLAAAWLQTWIWVPALGLIALLLLLFPTGRVPSPRWRAAAWALALSMGLGVAARALLPGPVDGISQVDNPFGVTAIGPALSVVAEGTALLTSVMLPVAAFSIGLRLRTAGATERQQIKWVGLSGVALAISFVSNVAEPWLPLPAPLLQLVLVLGLVVLPISIAVAVLRYRLYDIDVVINRAIVYTVVTATLLTAYLLGVLALRAVLRPVIGESDLAVAGSTLVVAALFRPVRARAQRVVDRRFYRRKYDAEQSTEALARRLRDQVDLESIGDELRSTVRRTVAPRVVGVWLPARERGDRGRRGRRPPTRPEPLSPA